MRTWWTKFIEHFLYIAGGMNRTGPDGMWDEEDGFYYDLLRFPDGSAQRLKVRSMVGLLPLVRHDGRWRRGSGNSFRRWLAAFNERLRQMPELLKSMHPTGPGHFGVNERGNHCADQSGAAAPNPLEDARRK